MILELEKAQKLKAKLRAGEPCFGAQIGLSDPAIAEIFGSAGFDWLVIDTEHSASNRLTVQAMLQAAAHTKAAVLARPLRLDTDEIRRFLDLGAQGILCPFINTGEEARQLVQACRYPPAGIRGYGPRRAGGYGLGADEYFAQANEALLCVPIIESPQAVQNIGEIVNVDGIDAVLVGPVDLSISLGIYKQIDHSTFLTAADRVRQACRKHRKAMGFGCLSLGHAQRYMSEGDVLLMVAGDESLLMSESRRYLEILRKR